MSGNHTVRIHWNLVFNVSYRLGGYRSEGTIAVYLLGNLYDNTTHRWVLGGSAPLNVKSRILHWHCVVYPLPIGRDVGGCPYLSPTQIENASLRVTASLSATDQYLCYSFVYAIVKVVSLSRSTTAELDFGAGSNGAWLRSLTVS